MNKFEVGKSILIKLVVNEIPFARVLKSTFKNIEIDPVDRSNVVALVGCELRHHYIFDNLISRFIGEVANFEDTIYLRFYLANHLFLHRFDEKELYSLAVNDLPQKEIDNLIKFIDSTSEIIPEELDKSSPEFLALRYNTPAWIIRMLQKQYGKPVVFKVLKVNYRPSVASIRIKEKEISVEDFLTAHPDYSPCSVENIMVYKGRGSAKILPEYKENKVFFMKMGTKDMIDHLDLSPLKSVAIYNETPNNIYQEILTRFGNDYSLDYVINHPQSLYEARELKKNLGLEHLYIYDSSYEGLVTCLSKKVDTFFCIPRCSMLDLLRSTPDYFLRVKQDQLDNIIAEEAKCLEECSKFVEDDGELVYAIPTLSKKESSNLIAEFLSNHSDFSLVEEHQYFPFESFDSCLYYARIKKMGKTDD